MISETLSCGCVLSSYQLLLVTVLSGGRGWDICGEHMVPPLPLLLCLSPSLHPSTFSLVAKRITALYRILPSGPGTCISRRCAGRGAGAKSWETKIQRARGTVRARWAHFLPRGDATETGQKNNKKKKRMSDSPVASGSGSQRSTVSTHS